MNSKITISYNEKRGKFYLQCPFMLNNAVRALPNRRFVKRMNAWEAPALLRNVECIDNLRRSGVAALEEGCQEIIDKVRERSSIVKKIGFSLKYKFKTDPFHHQINALQETYGLDQSALYMEMGTGKSKIIIDTACSYYNGGIIDTLLITCPVSIRSNWLEQLKIHAPIKYEAMVCDPGTKKKERDIEDFILTKTDKLKILILGIQSISQRSLNKPTGKSWRLAQKFMLCHSAMMVIDEAHLIKNHDSNRSRNAVLLGLSAKKRMIATGTPIANGIMDLYMQFQFLSPDIVGIGDFYSFRNRYAIMGGYENKQIVGYDNVDELMDLIRPWVFQCTKEEVLPDLPDKLYTVRKVKMNPAQLNLYREIKKDRMANLPALDPKGSNIQLIVESILAMNLALQQITGGFVTYAVEEPLLNPRTASVKSKRRRELVEIVEFKNNPKIRELLSVLDEHRGKPTIIWARFRKEIADITLALESKFGEESVVQYHGGVSKEDRDENERAFKAGEKQFFVANQATGGVGLTLNVANLSIYFSNDFNYIHRKQSEDRNHRIGQVYKVLYVDIIVENSVDDLIIQAIENKQDLADFVKSSMSQKPKNKLLSPLDRL